MGAISGLGVSVGTRVGVNVKSGVGVGSWVAVSVGRVVSVIVGKTNCVCVATGGPSRVGAAWQLVKSNRVLRKNAVMGWFISFDEFECA